MNARRSRDELRNAMNYCCQCIHECMEPGPAGLNCGQNYYGNTPRQNDFLVERCQRVHIPDGVPACKIQRLEVQTQKKRDCFHLCAKKSAGKNKVPFSDRNRTKPCEILPTVTVIVPPALHTSGSAVGAAARVSATALPRANIRHRSQSSCPNILPATTDQEPRATRGRKSVT